MAKISRQKQDEVRRSIILTAVELFGEKGFESTTMKQIARKVGIGDATIYKYFSSKDKLIFGYFGLKAEDTIQEFLKEEDLDDYDLQEKLQLLIDIYLGNLLPDREFVNDSLKMIMQSPSILFKDVTPIREEFSGVIHDLLIEAENSGEIAKSAFTGVTAKLANEFMLAVLLYWIKDDSDEFANTTQLVDMSLSLGVEILKSGIIGKVTDLASFFIKAHLFRFMGSGFLNKLVTSKSFSR
ncbi:TetR/AcrR family transcriptional regulator [Aliikangiella coralliicola]|uniref:TetR/AcrR family transcriptional regulator n=1 Tax=Aliikangiella coralliicola TaxID=2592383 RepID=A0A545UIN9_9GAMM|nr:TetR family transcriptional regulator [Aliikangiella coralliicola]TQV89325.1 TetR/AcrR family transcriptional regulator [Aliikangiella coralliicola]